MAENNQSEPLIEQEQQDEPRRERSIIATIGYALIYVGMVIGISVILACVGWMFANDVLALNKAPHTATVTLGQEISAGEVAELLKENGLIEYKFLFSLFSSITGAEEKISQGTFTLDTDMDYSALIQNLGSNSATRAEIKVTIPEGYTVDQIFALLEAKGVAYVSELEDFAANYDYAFDFLADVPLGDYRRLEGYLFPDTYTFYSFHNPLYVINKMLVNFATRLTEELRQEAENLGYSLHDIVTIASMIERETDGTDRANIASVIYNRLSNPSFETMGCLQIDATIYYLTGREVTQNDRETISSPYNTHINAGIPPGAIGAPGMESIMAALRPESTKYYYYALGDDGLHHYYTNYSSFLGFLSSQERYGG